MTCSTVHPVRPSPRVRIRRVSWVIVSAVEAQGDRGTVCMRRERVLSTASSCTTAASAMTCGGTIRMKCPILADAEYRSTCMDLHMYRINGSNMDLFNAIHRYVGSRTVRLWGAFLYPPEYINGNRQQWFSLFQNRGSELISGHETSRFSPLASQRRARTRPPVSVGAWPSQHRDPVAAHLHTCAPAATSPLRRRRTGWRGWRPAGAKRP